MDAYYGDAIAVHAHISLGVDVDARDKFKSTALMAASSEGHPAVVELLVAESQLIVSCTFSNLFSP